MSTHLRSVTEYELYLLGFYSYSLSQLHKIRHIDAAVAKCSVHLSEPAFESCWHPCDPLMVSVKASS